MVQHALQPPEIGPEPPESDASYGWYVAGVGSWFGAGGMQQVLFAWIVVGELQASAEWVGVAQSALMIPSFLLILVGGAVADRGDRRALLVGLHGVAALLGFGLLASVASDWLSLPLVIAYALGMGAVGAFVTPARDSLLSEVVGTRDMMRAVTGMTLVQWGAQAIGSLIGGAARWIGTVPALGIQVVVLLLGIPTLLRLRAVASGAPRGRRRLHLADLGVGLRETLGSPVLRSVLLLVVSVGLLFMGPFRVVFPLLVRDVYDGDVAQLGLLGMAFPVGTIAGSLGLLALGTLRRKGLAQLVSLFAGGCVLAAIGQGLSFAGTLGLVGLFGVTASVFMNASRTVFQERASARNRARVLSVYTLGFMGAGGLIGAPMAGLLVNWIGPLQTCQLNGGLMALLVLGIGLFTRVRRLE